MALIHFADKVSPDQRANLCSLICAFSVRRHILQFPLVLYADSEGPDQPALLHKLHKGPFRGLRILYNVAE